MKLQSKRVRALTVWMLSPLLLAGSMPAQSVSSTTGNVMPVPFGPGEMATYRATLGAFGRVGTGTMQVLGVEPVRGKQTYQLRFEIHGGIPFARVDTRLQSWLDVNRLISHRFEQDQDEVNYERHRIFEFFPEQGRWEIRSTDQRGELATDAPLDDVSFIYFVRTLPLEVGKTYTFNRYFKPDGNPVVVKVVRKERIKVPAGTFNTVVVQPVIQTKGLFGKGGRAEIYFTDDERHLVVQLKSRVPLLGDLTLALQEFKEGRPLARASASNAASAP